jgi:uncharacterized membrane protein
MPQRLSPNRDRFRASLRILLASFFAIAGSMHFLKPDLYLAIMPPMLPHPLALVWISGVAEVLGGVGLLIPQMRRWAGVGLIVLLIAVFPANIYMLMQSVQRHGWSVASMLLVLRLPLQFVFIAWVKYVM